MSGDSISNFDFKLAPTFLDGPSGSLFVQRFSPKPARARECAVLILPPFAEELNKARRMLALQAHSLAHNDYSVFLPDLMGTGDSGGEFGNFSWNDWIQDINFTIGWIEDLGFTSLHLLSLRSGAFFLDHIRAGEETAQEKVVMWNPVLSGTKMLDQMFRSRIVREIGAAEPQTVSSIRQVLMETGQIEIAGYLLTSNLVKATDELRLETANLSTFAHVLWTDVSPIKSDRTPPLLAKLNQSREAANAEAIRYTRQTGPAFWMGPEIEVLPDLVQATTDFLVR